MTDFVRVRLENGAHASLPAGFAKSHGLTVLKQDAVGKDGKALVDKPKTTAKKAAGSTTPSSSDVAATTKEESK